MTRILASVSLLFFALAPQARGQALNEWDVGFALKDLTHRAISLEYLNLDPYRVTDAVPQALPESRDASDRCWIGGFVGCRTGRRNRGDRAVHGCGA